jgi:hypothetical protein
MDDTKQAQVMIGTRVSPPELAKIEAYRSRTCPVLSRSEALRRLLDDALAKDAEQLT